MFNVFYQNQDLKSFKTFDEAEDFINARIISLKGTANIVGILKEIKFYEIKEQNVQKETFNI